MNDLVDKVRHADEILINDLIFAVVHRFGEICPDRELIVISMEKNRNYLEQIYDNLEFLDQFRKNRNLKYNK